MKKRVFSLILAAVIALTVLPFSVSADDVRPGGGALSDWAYSLDSDTGAAVLNRYLGSAADVTVPGQFEYQGQTYTAVLKSSTVFCGSYNLKSVKICSGVKFDGGAMSQLFLSCPSLTSFDLSEADTAGVTSMKNMFTDCRSLTEVVFPAVDTSSVTDMSYMFYGCASLSSVDFSAVDTSDVENMSNMFCNCASLRSFDFSALDICGAKDISYMFAGCTSLSSVDFSHADTSSVTDMSSLFAGCTSLTAVDLSPLNTGAVTEAGGLFSGCSSLSEINFTGFDTSNIRGMSGMFLNCGALTSLDLSEFDTGSAETISEMFEGCVNLSGLTGYENWNTSSLVNMSYAFNKFASSVSASAQVSIDLSRWDLSHITNSGWCFQNCAAQQIILPENIAVISAGFMNHAVRYAGSSFTVPAGVNKIGYAHTFYDFATNDFTEFTVAQGNTAYKTVDGVLYSADGKEMLAVPRNKPFENGVFEIPEGVDFLGELSFSRNYNINTVVLPDSFELTYVPLKNQRYIVYNDVGNINAGTNLSIAIYCYTGITDYAVKDTNPRYSSADGIIYSKDMTRVAAVPSRYNRAINIPEGVTHWDKEAMWADSDEIVDNLLAGCPGVNLPSTIKTISTDQLEKLNRLHKNRAGTAYPFTITLAGGNTAFCIDAEGCLRANDTDTFYIDYGDITFTSSGATGYDANGNYLTSSPHDSYTVTQQNPAAAADHCVIIRSGSYNITLDSINIERKSTSAYAVQIQSGATAALTLDGENHVTSGSNYAALEINSNASVTIGGSGSLYAQSPKYAGIGGSSGYSLTINSGDIHAESGGTYPGIYCSNSSASLTVCGGSVTARGGRNAAGIGASGYTNNRGKIVINGGTVTAYGGESAAGIGGGIKASSDAVIINGGSVKAVPGLNAQGIGNGYNCTTAFAGTFNSQGSEVSLHILDAGGADRVYFGGIDTVALSHHPDDNNYYFYTCDNSSVTAYGDDGVKFYTGAELTEVLPYAQPCRRVSDYLLTNDTENFIASPEFTFTDGSLFYAGRRVDACTPALAGDVNLDGSIDGEDAVLASCVAEQLLAASYNRGMLCLAADYDLDGIITGSDAALLEAAGLFITLT